MSNSGPHTTSERPSVRSTPLMSSRISLVFTSTLLAVACGKTTTNSDGASTGSGGSSLDGSAEVPGNSVNTGTNEATMDAGTTSSSGNSWSAGEPTGYGGEAGTIAAKMGCVLTVENKVCSSNSEAVLRCPKDSFSDTEVPASCSKCIEPHVNEHGNHEDQCPSFSDGTPCHYCCCDLDRSGCQEEPEYAEWCVRVSGMSHYVLCVAPYEPPAGCVKFSEFSNQVDQYCCP